MVIEDAAQSIGGTLGGRKCGSFGTVAGTSFYPAKPLGCYGDGGAMFTDDDALAAKLRSLAFHGKGETQYDNIHVGLNSRLDTLQAAILIEKLAILEDEMVARQKVAARYAEGLGDVVKVASARQGSRSAWAQYAIETPHRDALKAHLQAIGIPSVIYYVKPLHQQVAYRALSRRADAAAGFGGAAGADPVPADAPLSRRRGPGPHHRDDPQLRRQQFVADRRGVASSLAAAASCDRCQPLAARDEVRIGEIRQLGAAALAIGQRHAVERRWSCRRPPAARRRRPPCPIPWCGRSADRGRPRRWRSCRISATSRPRRSRPPRNCGCRRRCRGVRCERLATMVSGVKPVRTCTRLRPCDGKPLADRDRLGMAGIGRMHLTARRREDDADCGHAIADERDVDGEVGAPVDEFAGAVERIDQQESRRRARTGRCRPRISSSATQGMSGNALRSPSRISLSLARSASVTGEASALRVDHDAGGDRRP